MTYLSIREVVYSRYKGGGLHRIFVLYYICTVLRIHYKCGVACAVFTLS